MSDIVINNINADKLGSIQISEEVISVIAGTACFEVDEVVGMTGISGIIDKLGKKNLAKGIEIEMQNNGIIINVNVVLEFGSKIGSVADKIQDKVKSAIESMTNLNVLQVNVNITDLKEM